jgi:hypothetical protein
MGKYGGHGNVLAVQHYLVKTLFGFLKYVRFHPVGNEVDVVNLLTLKKIHRFVFL